MQLSSMSPPRLPRLHHFLSSRFFSSSSHNSSRPVCASSTFFSLEAEEEPATFKGRCFSLFQFEHKHISGSLLPIRFSEAASFSGSLYLARQFCHTSPLYSKLPTDQKLESLPSGVDRSFNTEGAVVGEYIELNENLQEELGTEENGGMVSEEELHSCEGVDISSSILEVVQPQADFGGRSYLHVLSVEEVQIILEKVRAEDVQVIHVRDLCEWADHVIVASGHSARHVRGIADSIVFHLKKRSTNVGMNVFPTVEGRESDQWMVVDCGSIVVHVFRQDVRGYYSLEELWRKRRSSSSNLLDVGY